MAGNILVDAVNKALGGGSKESLQDVSSIIEQLLNIENLDQKSRLLVDEINILIGSQMILEYEKCYLTTTLKDAPESARQYEIISTLSDGTQIAKTEPEDYADRIEQKGCNALLALVVSLEGRGRLETIELFRRVDELVDEKNKIEAAKMSRNQGII